MKLLITISIFLLTVYTQSQWIIQPSGINTTLRKVTFYNQNTGWAAGDGGQILKTTNSGLIWISLNTGVTQDLYSITFRDSLKLIACGSGGTIIRSTDAGANWQTVNSGTVFDLRSVITVPSIYNKDILAVGNNGTILSSTNDGASWIARNSNTTAQLNNVMFFFDGTSGYQSNAMGNNGTLKNSSGGSSWSNETGFPATSENLTGGATNTVATGHVLRFICGEGGGIFKVRKISFSNQWVQVNSGVTSPLRAIHSQADYEYNSRSYGKNVWAVGDNGVIRHSIDTGNSWFGQAITSSQNLYSVFMLDSLRGWVVGSGGLIAATVNGGGPPIGIKQVSTIIPDDFSLSQNYPNPFNPVTNIEFAIPKAAFVKLVVYDVSGRELETLVSRDMKAGTYKADWDASKYSSGVYFYRIEAGDFNNVKKMILVK